jgi:hypothetical protein
MIISNNNVINIKYKIFAINKNNIEMIGILHEYSRVKKHMMFQAKLVI